MLQGYPPSGAFWWPRLTSQEQRTWLQLDFDYKKLLSQAHEARRLRDTLYQRAAQRYRRDGRARTECDSWLEDDDQELDPEGGYLDTKWLAVKPGDHA